MNAITAALAAAWAGLLAWAAAAYAYVVWGGSSIGHAVAHLWSGMLIVWHAWLGYCVTHWGMALVWLGAAALTTFMLPRTVRPGWPVMALMVAVTLAGGFGLGYTLLGGAA